MFCSNCGNKNEKNANFCENCGTKIERKSIKRKEEAKNKIKEEMKNKKLPKRKRYIILILIGIIVCLAISYKMIEYHLSPSTIAKNYFLAVMNADMDKIYQYVESEESEFINQEMLEKILEIHKESKKKIMNYKVTSVEEDKNGLYTTVTIHYIESGSDDYEITKIRLIKQHAKKFLFFDDWRIYIKELDTVDDYVIKVLQGSKVKIENIEVDEKYKDKDTSNGYYDIYKMPSMFAGKYKLQIEMPIGLTIEDTIRVANHSSYMHMINKEDIPESVKQTMLDTIQTGLQLLYNSAIGQKGFTEMEALNDANLDLSKLEETYTSFAHDLRNTGLTNIEFTDLEFHSIRTKTDGSLLVTVKTNYKYKVFSNEGQIMEKNQSSTMQINLIYQENKFRIINVLNLNTYFSK